MRVETIFGGLPCRRSLTPRVSPSRAPVFSFTHYFQAPATQSNLLHLIGVLLPIRNSLAPDFRTIQNTHELGLAGFQFDLLPIFTRQWHSPANSASYLNFLFRKPKLKSLTKYLHVVKAVFSRNFLVVSKSKRELTRLGGGIPPGHIYVIGGVTRDRFKRRISHVPNLTRELNACEVRRLNQLNSTV